MTRLIHPARPATSPVAKTASPTAAGWLLVLSQAAISLLLLIGAATAPAQITPIDDIQQYNPLTGAPESPYIEANVRGVVSVGAEIYGPFTHYLWDGTGGIMFGAIQPPYAAGDSLEISAVVTAIHGEIILTSAYFTHLGSTSPVEPTPIQVGALAGDYENVGQLFSTIGQVSAVGDTTFYLKAASESVLVYCIPYTDISMTAIDNGAMYRVNGICGNYDGEIRLLPRGNGDLIEATEIFVNPAGTGDVPTIQDAVDIATTGTLIWLDDGIYTGDGNRDVDYLGKQISIMSLSQNPTTCTIDCQGSASDYHRGFVLDSYEPPGTLLKGVTITNGYETYGGAVLCDLSASPTIEDCRFAGNEAKIEGGAIYCGTKVGAEIRNCDFDGNFANTGGGLHCDATAAPWIYMCTFHANMAMVGNGLSTTDASPYLEGCTFYGNGLWFYGLGDPSLSMTIIAYNSGPSIAFAGFVGTATLTCCDLFGNAGGDWVAEISDQLGNNGNISADPQFLDGPGGDYRLLFTSPCAPENSGSCELIGAWPVVVFSVNPTPGQGDYDRIQDAVDAVPDSVTIELADGVYTGTRNVDIDPAGKPMVIRSQSGDPNSCIIDCMGAPPDPHRAFWFHSGEDANTKVKGIKIVNGYAASTKGGGGGGILCENGSSPGLEDLILENNRASTGGGGLHVSDGSEPVIDNCEFTGNQSGADAKSESVAKATNTGGGGLHVAPDSGAIVNGSTFDGNRSTGTSKTAGPLVKAMGTGGGGLHVALNGNLVMSNCTVVLNSSDDGGAIYCEEGSALTLLNTIVAYSIDCPAVHCDTLVTLDIGCTDVYGNAGGDWVGCLAGWEAVNNNFSVSPFFCDLPGGDYSLSATSPCLDVNNPSCGTVGAWGLGNCGGTYVVKPDGSGDFPTIQAAVDALPGGSIIELADGTFTGTNNRNINVSKSLTIRSQAKGAESCIIDCQGGPGTTRRGFSFSGGGTLATLQGVKIINGYVDSLAEPNDRGGAILCEAASPGISGCVFEHNHAANWGGAIYFASSGSQVSDCTFRLNTSGDHGGAVCIDSASPEFAHCLFDSNTSDLGGAVYSTDSISSPNYSYCTFTKNKANNYGGALHCYDLLHNAPKDSLFNCTMFGNFAPQGSGIATDGNNKPVVQNSIIAYGSGSAVYCYFALSPKPRFSCSDIFGNSGGDWTGCIASQMGTNGNLSVDPMFCDSGAGDFHLSGLSPCAADNNPECLLIGAWPEQCPPTGIGEPEIALPRTFRLHGNVPNPFNPVTKIRFELPRDAEVKLTVYDLAGRQVARLVDEPLQAGYHEVLWNGREGRGRTAASGVYFYRIEAGPLLETRRMLLLK
jgi:predicted outer membrane repeat protein